MLTELNILAYCSRESCTISLFMSLCNKPVDCVNVFDRDKHTILLHEGMSYEFISYAFVL
jgi:hypothetical protein